MKVFRAIYLCNLKLLPNIADIKIANLTEKGTASKKQIKVRGKMTIPIIDLISPELFKYKETAPRAIANEIRNDADI